MNETKSMPSSLVKPYAGNSHVRFEEGEVVPAATLRRGVRLYKVNWIGSMKYILTIIASLVFTRVFAYYTETVGDYTWTYRISGDTAEIFNNWDTAISPFPTNAVTIPSVLGGKPVTSIGDYALSDCDELPSVTIPNSVTSIGAGAFAFCEEMESVSIPSSVTSIGRRAFYYCSGLTSVTIPNGVTSICDEAFDSCYSLVSVTIPSSVASIGDGAFEDCDDSLFDTNSIPGVKLVDGWAIGKTGPLSGILDLTGVRGIGDQVFCGCSELTSVKIPDSVKSIGKNAFAYCEGLINVIIGNGGTSIGEGAFSSCGRLTNVTIGNGATSIGDGAFMECTNLMSVTIGDGATSIGPRAFSNCEGLESVTVGDGLTCIGAAAFSGCSNLKSLSLPDSVTSIGDYAFFGCTSLEDIPSPGSTGYTGDVADSIWVPVPVGLTLEGEPCVIINDDESLACVEKHFLVAGSNATAKVAIDDYSGKWKRYDLYGSGVTGAFRHTIKKIFVLGYAAAELNDIPIPDPNSKDYLEIYPESKAMKMFKQGMAADHDLGGCSTAMCERATGFFTSPARHDIAITVDVEKIDDDGEAYRIVSIVTRGGTEPLVVPSDLWPDEVGRDGVFEFPFMLPTGSGLHGQYYWTAAVVYKHEWSIDKAVTDTALNSMAWYSLLDNMGLGSLLDSMGLGVSWDNLFGSKTNVVDEALNFPHGEEIATKGLEAQLFITNEMGRVFFDKYGKDAEGGGNPNWFTYWKEDGACPCLKRYEGKIVMGGTKADYGEWKDDGDKLVHLATKVKYDELGKGVDMIGPAAFHYPGGLTFTHKTFTSKSYSFPEKGGGSIYGLYTVEEVVMHELFHEKLDRLYEELYHKGTDNWISKLAGNLDSDRKDEPYTWESCHVYDNGICVSGECRSRRWCDSLVDFEEDWFFGPFSDFKLDMYDTDTYNLKTKNPGYGAYGDNEFLCMIEANKASRRTVEDGGADPSKDWAFPGEQSYRPTLPLKNGENNAANGLLRNNSMSEQPIINLIGFTSTIDHATDGLVSAICYSLEMQSSRLGELGMHATLTDMDGNSAAIAYASANEGSSVVTFRFDGRDVYESGLAGPFRMNTITISRFDGNDSYELATLSEFKDAEVDLRREDLARNDAYLLDVGDETVTTNGLVVSVNVEVNTTGVYYVSATLVNTNGVPVASCRVSKNCMQGTNHVSVVFLAGEILQSGIDGPYEIDNITLSKDGARIDSRLHFYSTRKMYRSGAFDFDDDTELNPTRFMSQFADYTPPSELPPPEWFWVFFNPNGGTMSETAREVIGGEKVGTLPIPSRENNKFLGWYTELEGGVKITDSTKVTTNIMLHAHWEYTGSVMVAAAVAEGCEAMGKVSGGGKTVKSGTKVSLKATANKGYAFVGWCDAAVSSKPPYLSHSASFTYIATGEPITIVAVFASAGDDAQSLKVEVADDVSTEADGSLSLDLGECVESLSQPKLSVSGLPSGVKFDSKSGVISGKATKPGVYTVKVTATNASATGKNAVVETFNITVPNFKWDEDAVGVALEDKYLLQAGIAPALSNEIAAITGGGWKLAVSGLPSGVKFDAKKGLFTGVATKEGFYTVYFTATRGSGKTAEKQVATATFEVVFPTLSLGMAAWSDASATNKCKVAGGGKFPFGKKVTVKATANKGSVFMGWEKKGNGEWGTGNGFVSQAASLSFAMPLNDVEYVAKFITAAEDKDSIKLAVDGVALAAGAGRPPYRTNIWCGVYLEWPVAASALSEAKVKVASLPAGLKFTDKPLTSKIGTGKTAVVVTNVPANTIYGAPTAASKVNAKTSEATPSVVKFTVTTAGKSTQTYQIDVVVEALPAWAQGTFVGALWTGARDARPYQNDDEEPNGIVSLTVSAAGKVSGKAQGDGLAYTLAAPYYSGFEAIPVDEGLVSNFLADVTASWSYKEGGKTIKTNDVVQLTVQDNGIGGCALVEDWLKAYTVNWKAEPWKMLGKSFDKKTMAYAILSGGSFSEKEEDLTSALGADVTGRVTLKFAASGTVTVSGEFAAYDAKKEKYTTVKASGSATLVPVSEDNISVFVYLTPKGLAPHARSISVLYNANLP